MEEGDHEGEEPWRKTSRQLEGESKGDEMEEPPTDVQPKGERTRQKTGELTEEDEAMNAKRDDRKMRNQTEDRQGTPEGVTMKRKGKHDPRQGGPRPVERKQWTEDP